MNLQNDELTIDIDINKSYTEVLKQYLEKKKKQTQQILNNYLTEYRIKTKH